MAETPTQKPATGAPVFQAKGIGKYYNGNHRLEVLKSLDLDLHTGEMIAIVGASGTGKTTLLHILGALDRPTSGSLLYQGRDVFQLSNQELSALRNRTVGFVFQFHHLLPEFSALENVMMPGLIAGIPHLEIEDKAQDLLARVSLQDRTTHKVGELSGGEQQRVAFARAMVMSPTLLLADEPTGNLDPKTGDKVFGLMLELNASLALTMVMVTHNLKLAAQMDRCLSLTDGKLHEVTL